MFFLFDLIGKLLYGEYWDKYKNKKPKIIRRRIPRRGFKSKQIYEKIAFYEKLKNEIEKDKKLENTPLRKNDRN